jgi:hypothetical protein
MFLKTGFAVWIAGAVVAGAAFAQEAIPTAAGSPTGGAPPTTSNGPLRLPEHHFDDGDDIVRSVGPCGVPARADGKPDRSPHGQVFAGVGTNGYREGGGIVCVPIGDKAAVTVAVDAGRIGERGGRH